MTPCGDTNAFTWLQLLTIHAAALSQAFSTWVTWAAAEETCVSHGGHLVSVGGPSEQRALRRCVTCAGVSNLTPAALRHAGYRIKVTKCSYT